MDDQPTHVPDPSAVGDTTRADGLALPAPPGNDSPSTMRYSGLSPGATPPVPRGEGLPRERHFGKYELVSVLGRGGMGVVYKALHCGLSTVHAVKVLHAGTETSREAVTRFQREGQVLAKLKHPAIVQVHDIGEDHGQTWLAMEYVEGTPLDKLIHPGVGAAAGDKGLPPAEAIRVTREIAEAIQFAHEAGVLHRDLKPANVIRENSGGLKVMDFGLAKVVEAGDTGATRSGDLIGTPAYLSPEHVVEGMKAVDAQSDVYQIGAILYELLTGRRPYLGSSAMEMMARIASEDPLPPRTHNPALALDAETICLRAIARDKAQRYPTARALAEDCARFLAGEAVLARRESPGERAWRWVRRRKTLVAAIAVVVLSIVAVSGSLRQAYMARAEGARLQAEVLQGLRSIARLSLDATLELRHAGGKMSIARARFLPPLEAAVRDAVQKAPGLAEPHYHLGRMYRALLRSPDALPEQEQALAAEPGYAPARYERAVLTLLLYADHVADLRERWAQEEIRRWAAAGQQQQGVERTRPTDDELAGRDAEATRLQQAIAADLARLSDAPDAALPPAMLACVRGLEALTVGGPARAEEGKRLLEEAVRAEPALEEAHLGLARLALARGDAPAAMAVYDRAIAADPGYFLYLLKRGDLLLNAGLELQEKGEDGVPRYREALADYDRVLALDDSAVVVLRKRAEVFASWASADEGRGSDPDPLFEKALAEYDRAVEKMPKSIDAWCGRGALRTNWGLSREQRGGDPEPLYEEAEKDYTRALELDAQSAPVWLARALLRMNWGVRLGARGGDPTERWTPAIADCERALALDPRPAEAWLVRGHLRVNSGKHAGEIGQDPRPFYQAAEEDYSAALERDPGAAGNWLARGMLRGNQALDAQVRGLDPEPVFQGSTQDFGRAIDANPGLAEAWIRRGTVQMNWGVFHQGRGEDPGPLYEAALADFARALERDRTRNDAWLSSGMTRVNWAVHDADAGRSPEARLEQALADYGHALELNPAGAEPWLDRAVALTGWGNYLQKAGKDPSERYGAALADYAQALERNPKQAEAWTRRGNLRANWGSYVEDKGQDPGTLFGDALADYDKALELNAGSGQAWLSRGTLRFNWGNAEKQHGRDASALHAAALKDFDQAVARNAGSVDARWKRGWIHFTLEHWKQAVDDFEAAKALNPATESYFKELLEQARAKLR